MSCIFRPFPCAAPENPSAWREFLKISLIVKQCDAENTIPHWGKLLVCLTTLALLALGTWQIFQLCLLPPKDNKDFTKDEFVILRYLKINFHDFSLITKAISLYSNLTLLYNVIAEDHGSLLNSVGFNASMLFLRIALALVGRGLGIVKADYGDVLREGSLYVMQIVHLVQLSCVTHHFYRRCTFFV